MIAHRVDYGIGNEDSLQVLCFLIGSSDLDSVISKTQGTEIVRLLIMLWNVPWCAFSAKYEVPRRLVVQRVLEPNHDFGWDLLLTHGSFECTSSLKHALSTIINGYRDVKMLTTLVKIFATISLRSLGQIYLTAILELVHVTSLFLSRRLIKMLRIIVGQYSISVRVQ